MKKLFYTAGALVALAVPLVAAVSCSDKREEQSVQPKDTRSVQSQQLSSKQNITIDVRIPDFDHEVVYNQATFDNTKFVEAWHYEHRQPIHKMIPYVLDREIKIPQTGALTLGGLMDELNKKEELFKFSSALEDASSMGRFLMGVKMSDQKIAADKITDIEHYGYWAMHWRQVDATTWAQDGISFEDPTYISLSSPNNAQAVKDSHTNFDRNESFHFFDERLPKGIDGIKLGSNDVFDLNLWTMI